MKERLLFILVVVVSAMSGETNRLVDLAHGISDTVIGLTLVAVGTSLPELATSVVAARRGGPPGEGEEDERPPEPPTPPPWPWPGPCSTRPPSCFSTIRSARWTPAPPVASWRPCNPWPAKKP